MKLMKRMLCTLLAASLVPTCYISPLLAQTTPKDAKENVDKKVKNHGEKWHEQVMPSKYTKVLNYGGAILGYSKESGIKLIEDDGYAFKDLNKNGKLDIYEDWRIDYDTRARDLASQLPIESIAGLMLYSGHQSDLDPNLTEEQRVFLKEDGVRAVLNANADATTEETVNWSNAMQRFVEGLDFGIPVNFSSDPRSSSASGEAYSVGNGPISKWPSNLGLAATFEPEITKEFGQIASDEYRALGITTALSPQVDIASEPRWSRINGTFGEDPALSRDLTKAYIDGFQSTYVNGMDVGWGEDSVNAMIKHWPGDGTGEGGRESHSQSGKYAVYPGGQFETHLIPFVDGGFDLEGKTDYASAVMPSYSIAVSLDDSTGEKVGSSYSTYKIHDLLRGQYEYDGVICTDWMITPDPFMCWGVSDLTEAERHYKILMAGVDQFGGNNVKQPVLDAYEIGVKEHGEAFMIQRFQDSAYRLLKNIFYTGAFENPYLDLETSLETVGNAEYRAAGYDAQLKSIVMLKNKDNFIHKDGFANQKPTVYIPMVYTPMEKVNFGPINDYTPASWDLPVNLEVANQFFNVVTDTVAQTPTGPLDDNGNPTLSEKDIVRATPEQLKKVDFSIAIVSSPQNVGSMFTGQGHTTKDGYIPMSLQYGEYTANGESVRKQSIGADEGENRSYFGKTAQVSNATDLDAILYAADQMNTLSKETVVMVRADNPMIFSEFEDKVDSILMGFGVSDQAMFDIIVGKVEPQGLLPLQMPANMATVEAQFEDVPRDMQCHVDNLGNVYDFAYGLSWSGVINDERVQTYKVPALQQPQNK